jgi:hypothetical protein
MKKILALAALAAALAFVFPACGGGSSIEDDDFIVTFDLGDVDVDNPEFYEPQSVPEGELAVMPPNPQSTGWDFLGWSWWDKETAGNRTLCPLKR